MTTHLLTFMMTQSHPTVLWQDQAILSYIVKIRPLGVWPFCETNLPWNIYRVAILILVSQDAVSVLKENKSQYYIKSSQEVIAK